MPRTTSPAPCSLSWLRCRSAIKAARCTAAVQEYARALHARLSAANNAVRQCERDVRRCTRAENVVTKKSCYRTKFARCACIRTHGGGLLGGSCASHVSTCHAVTRAMRPAACYVPAASTCRRHLGHWMASRAALTPAESPGPALGSVRAASTYSRASPGR